MSSALLLDVGDWLLQTTVDVGILVAALLVVEKLAGRQLGPFSRYLLWSLVLLRLLLPAQPADPFGWKIRDQAAPLSMDATPREASLPAAAHFLPPPRARADRIQLTSESTTAEPLLVVEDGSDSAANPEPRSPRRPEARPTATRLDPSTELTPSSLTAAAPWYRNWRETLVYGWAVGALICLSRLLVLELRFRVGLRRDAREAGPELQAAVDRARGDAGMVRPIRVLVTPCVPTPAVCGVFRPRLLMPPVALQRLDASELRHVLAHEVAHLRAFDPLFRWALAIARALHWHNPLAWLGLRRVQEAQEVVRDYQALGAQPDADPGDYAGTLLKLGTPPPRPQPAPLSAILEDGTTLKRRIQMVIDFPLRRGSTLLGATLIAGLAWASITGAAPAPTATPDTPTLTQDPSLKKIRVVRRSPVPEWKTAMMDKLAMPLDLPEEATLAQIADALRDKTQLNVVLGPDMETDEPQPVGRGTLTAARVLDGLRENTGLEWSLSPGVLLIDYDGGSASSYDLRFYSILELIGSAEEPIDVADWLQEILYNLTWQHWETEYASMSYFNGLLIVNQTDRGHRRIEEALNLLLNRGKRVSAAETSATSALQAKLDLPIDVKFDEQGFGAVVRVLSEKSGVPIYLHQYCDDACPVSLELKGLTLREVLSWIARQTWTHVVIEDELVRFMESPATQVEVYEVEDLISRNVGDEEVSEDHLIELVHSSVGWESWDIEGASTQYWNGMLIVEQTPAAHAGIASFLDALRTAL